MCCLRPGLCYLVKGVLRLKAGGLLWGGVPCSLLIWLSSPLHKRNEENNMLGNPDVRCVALSNLMLSRFALVCLLAIVRDVWFAIEQPTSSVLSLTPYYRYLLELLALRPVFVRTCGPHLQHCSVSMRGL